MKFELVNQIIVKIIIISSYEMCNYYNSGYFPHICEEIIIVPPRLTELGLFFYTRKVFNFTCLHLSNSRVWREHIRSSLSFPV